MRIPKVNKRAYESPLALAVIAVLGIAVEFSDFSGKMYLVSISLGLATLIGLPFLFFRLFPRASDHFSWFVALISGFAGGSITGLILGTSWVVAGVAGLLLAFGLLRLARTFDSNSIEDINPFADKLEERDEA